jgi:hypothetical protein
MDPTFQDVKLVRDAGNILAQRNGTNAQTFRVYNTYTDASNYERGVFDWTTTANTLTLGTDKLGTGSDRGINITIGGTVVWSATTDGNLLINQKSGALASAMLEVQYQGTSIMRVKLATIDCFQNIGFPNATQLINWGGDVTIARSGSGVIEFGTAGTANSNACILAKTKAGAPTTSDVPASSWALIRDTTNATTKLYYNNAGTLQSVALT